MGPLRAFVTAIACVATVLSSAAQGRESERWREIAVDAADRFGLPVEWVMRVIEAESAGRTELGGRPITSHAGAMGLMQIMPATWAGLRAQYGLGDDPHDPRDNIVAGTAYLRAMYDRFGYPGLFGAYNAGPGRYAQYVTAGRPLPRETRDYMTKITGAVTFAKAPNRRGRRLASEGLPPVADTIFFARRGALDARPRSSADAPEAVVAERVKPLPEAGGLFAVRRDGTERGQ